MSFLSWAQVMNINKDLALNSNIDLGLIGDHRGLNKLRQLGHGDKREQAIALKNAAAQFESLLMKQWMDAMQKSNETLNPDSPLQSKYSVFFKDMLNAQQVNACVNNGDRVNKNSITYLITKQFAKSLGDEGEELLKELEQGSTQAIDPMQTNYVKGYKATNYFSQLQIENNHASLQALREAYQSLPELKSLSNYADPQDFVDKLMPYAVKATKDVGMNPLVLVAQAALETGWGKHVPSNNNYYGIKAGSSWEGETMDLSSAEFEGDGFVDRVSSFRAYPSVLESMKDYVKLITTSNRYAKASQLSFDPKEYFKEIQNAGYATDPNYADKLINISQKIAFMAYK